MAEKPNFWRWLETELAACLLLTLIFAISALSQEPGSFRFIFAAAAAGLFAVVSLRKMWRLFHDRPRISRAPSPPDEFDEQYQRLYVVPGLWVLWVAVVRGWRGLKRRFSRRQ